MKNLILIISFAIFSFGISCNKTKTNCFDQNLKDNHSGICVMDCPGVVGCDGKTYCNECDANKNGITVD